MRLCNHWRKITWLWFSSILSQSWKFHLKFLSITLSSRWSHWRNELSSTGGAPEKNKDNAKYLFMQLKFNSFERSLSDGEYLLPSNCHNILATKLEIQLFLLASKILLELEWRASRDKKQLNWLFFLSYLILQRQVEGNYNFQAGLQRIYLVSITGPCTQAPQNPLVHMSSKLAPSFHVSFDGLFKARFHLLYRRKHKTRLSNFSTNLLTFVSISWSYHIWRHWKLWHQKRNCDDTV